MSRKVLEKAVALSLLLSAGMYSTVWAQDVNIYNNPPRNYNKDIDGNLTITVDENYKVPVEGNFGNIYISAKLNVTGDMVLTNTKKNQARVVKSS